MVNNQRDVICFNDDVDFAAREVDAAQVAMNASRSCWVTELGRLGCSGMFVQDLPTGDGFQEIAIGGGFGCALKSNGKIECWGGNSPHGP